MLSVKECRAILKTKAEDISDEKVEEVRDALYNLLSKGLDIHLFGGIVLNNKGEYEK